MTPCRMALGALTLVLFLVLPSTGDAAPFSKGPYLQKLSQTSVTVMWESAPNTEGTLRLHTTPARTFASQAESIHEVLVDGLQPGTRYQYTVESAGEERLGEFATAPTPGTAFTFVVFGDSRSNANAHARVVERVRQEVPDFLVGTGDIVNEGSSEEDWSKLFEIEGELLRETVLFPSLGNHDRQGRGKTASNYRKYFSVPENSPDPERYYAFSYASARFLVLDSNAYSFALTDQTAWIEEQLQAARLNPQVEHIFVTMHHPPFSISLHGGQSDLREAWTPLFEKYQVAAVFSGHDHVYSRAEKNGVKYFVSGGGGAPLYGRKKTSKSIDKEAVKFFERVNHHLRVHVVGGQLEVTAVRADGTLIETLSWRAARETHPGDRTFVAGDHRAREAPAIGAGELRVAPKLPSSRKGFGLMGILGVVMTLSAGVVVFWAWRQ